MSLFKTVLLIAGLACVIQEVLLLSHPRVTSSEEEEFCYIPSDTECGPSVWPGECSTGNKQSPININFEGINVVWKRTFLDFNEAYKRRHSFRTRNTGESFMVQLDSMDSLKIDCGALDGSYTFAQLHFHWGQRNNEGSEHTLQGRRFPLEMHVVHYKTRYGSFTNAMEQNDPEAIAVFAIFFNLGVDNPSLGPIVQAAMQPNSLEQQEDFSSHGRSLDIRGLLPRNMDFIRYLGSLTTPPCTQKVIWTVFANPVPISQVQLNAFRKLRNGESEEYFNFRPTQPVNGRQVTYFKVTDGKKGITKKVDGAFSIFQNVLWFIHEIIHQFQQFILSLGVNKGVILFDKATVPDSGIKSWFHSAVHLTPLHVLFK